MKKKKVTQKLPSFFMLFKNMSSLKSKHPIKYTIKMAVSPFKVSSHL